LRESHVLTEGLAEIVIVDNHSPPHRLVPRLRRARGVSVRRWKNNRGFARAVNEGCRLSRSDWFLLLNPDTTVPPGFLDQVMARIGQLDSNAGIVGFRLLDDDGGWQLSTGRFPGFAGTLARLVLPRRSRKYTAPTIAGPSEVDWVTGCCLLVRRECLHDLGGLDPDFFLYYEDVDLCRRARQAGWSVWFDPSSSIVHHRPLHSRPVSPHLRLITRHALLTYALKHWPGWQVPLLGSLIRLEANARRMLAWCKGDTQAASLFAEMDQLVVELVAGKSAEAQARLRRIVRTQETSRVVASVDRHPLPQPA
jgi:GT2 family glycosyltransferase